MHKILKVKLFGNRCKKLHPILNHKDLRLSMLTVYFSIDFVATTSCPLNILKCMITHLYQTLTLLKKVTKINSVIKWHKLLGIQRPISIELTISIVCESCSNHRRESETMMKRIETEKREARHRWSMLITTTLITFVGSFTVVGCRKWRFNRRLCLWISSLQFSLPASCLSINWRALYLFARSCDGADISSLARLASPTSCRISYAPEILYSNTKWISSPFSKFPWHFTT